MPASAHATFAADIGRAAAVLNHAGGLPTADPAAALLHDDLLRTAWMFAVGALDAYFCDAYTDLVAATVSSKSRHPDMALPPFVDDIRFPLRAVLQTYPANQNWRWRIAARRLMERENVLSLDDARDLFRHFCRPGHKPFQELLAGWVAHPASRPRVFGLTPARLNVLDGKSRDDALKAAHKAFQDYFRSVIQRRHDCIHTCDRPRRDPQPISAAVVGQVVEDVTFLVRRLDEHLHVEFREFLLGCGCPPAVVAQSGYAAQPPAHG